MAHPTLIERLDTKLGAAVGLAIVVAIALMLRLWNLGSIPTVFFHDEADNSVNAIQILEGVGPGVWDLDWKPQPALAVNLLAGSVRVLGPSVAAIRMPSAIFSVLALIVFFFVAKRVAGNVPALLAALMLGSHTGYLHFSRTGWENVQICFYTLAAMECAERAAAKAKWGWWAAAGAAAAFGAMTYFAGRLILPVLLLWVAVRLVIDRQQRGRLAAGAALMLLVFAAVVAPIVPDAIRDWQTFNRRAADVLITRHVEGEGTGALLEAVARNAGNALTATFTGRGSNQPRYTEVGSALFGFLDLPLLLIGMVASFWYLRRTTLWWSALVVPFVSTQALTVGAPNLARGIGMIPVAFLFVALGMAACVRLARGRAWVFAPLLLLAISSAGAGARSYFRWAASHQLAAALEPAVPLADFDDWWTHVSAWSREGRGFFNVGMWWAHRGRTEELEQEPAPAVTRMPSQPTVSDAYAGPLEGVVYEGSTSGAPYQIDLGTVQLQTGRLRVTVSSVEGSDCVYDYVEIVDDSGTPLRLEAEDPAYTQGDLGVPTHTVDNRWWLQSYPGFSEGLGLVALRSEKPAPLVTAVDLAPGRYELRLGSFTGDSANGPFKVRVAVAGVESDAPR